MYEKQEERPLTAEEIQKACNFACEVAATRGYPNDGTAFINRHPTITHPVLLVVGIAAEPRAARRDEAHVVLRVLVKNDQRYLRTIALHRGRAAWGNAAACEACDAAYAK